MRTTDTPSQIAGRYRISGRIGSGGMGDVLRAHDRVLGRTVALKILPVDLAVQPAFVESFLAEAQAVAQVSHSGVVQVHDWGQQDQTYFMVMEYVRGKNLRQVLAATPDGRLHPGQAAQVAAEVLVALAAAHDKGVVHRDVKPENVMLGTDGKIKVADFGIARALDRAMLTGGLMGTVAYVAPEQARGEPVDARADVYSTGCMLFELLTGSLPFEGDAAQILQQHLNSRVPVPSELTPSVPAVLDRIVARATAPAPENRYRSASEMARELSSAISGLGAAPPLSRLVEEMTSEGVFESFDTVVRRKPAKRTRRWIRWVIGFAVLALVAGGILYLGPTQVPQVVGEQGPGARTRIERAGLKVNFRKAFSDRAPGTVTGSRPSPGAWTRRGKAVAVSLSVGPKLSNVPAVIGMQLQQARQAIVTGDLVVGGVTTRKDREPAGRIIDQDPKPGTVRAGELVNLVVSEGPAILDLPPVTGKPEAEAQKTLTDLGFVVATDPVFDAAAPGTVLGQDPAAGQKLAQGAPVRLRVSKGRAPFAMPDVKGRPCSEARTQLLALEMKVVIQSAGGGPAQCAANKVLEQDPLPQSTRRAGDEGTLYVP